MAQARGFATIDLTQYANLRSFEVVVDNAKFYFSAEPGTSFTARGLQLPVGALNYRDSLLLETRNNTSNAYDTSALIKGIEFGMFDTALSGDEKLRIAYFGNNSNYHEFTIPSPGWYTLPVAGFTGFDTLWKTYNLDGIGGPIYLKSIQFQSDLIIPEPQTYALIFSTLALITTLLRRRSRINP